jgi:HK97 family phage major capsid protein
LAIRVRYPVLRGGDEYEDVLREIRDELRADNATRGVHSSAQTQERRQQVTQRGGSRFVAPGATDDVLDTLAAGGEIRVAERYAHTRGVHGPQLQRGGGLAGVMQKALAEATPSAGGWLVPPEVSREIMGLLRNRSAVMRMGVTVVPVKKSLAITSLSTGSTASYVPENAQAPISEPTFAQDVLLTPRDLVALVPVSDRLLRDAAENPTVDGVLRADMAEVLALRADLAFLRGTGSAGEPLGIRNTPGLTPAPDLGPDGATVTFDHLKDMLAALRAVNAPFARPGWVFNGRLLNTLEKLKDSTGRYLTDSGLLTFDASGSGGTLLGHRFQSTGQIPVGLTTGDSEDTTEVYFSSDWTELWVGEEQGLAIEASNEATYWDGTQWVSAFQNRQTLFRSVLTHDVGLRRPQLFTVMTGVRP